MEASESKTNPCVICGCPTPYLATALCHPCWELVCWLPHTEEETIEIFRKVFDYRRLAREDEKE